MPAKSYTAQVRSVNTVTQNGNFFFAPGMSNVSISLPFHENMLRIAVDGSVSNYSRITWSYGSGTLVRPLSKSCKFFIRYM